MARKPFATPDALIVVSTDGYFDVYPAAGHSPHDRPSYRGALAELGPTIHAGSERLSVRPDSVVLRDAVSVWSSRHGTAAVAGELGLGRGSAA